MFPNWLLLAAAVAYLSFLFLAAYYAEQRERKGRSIVANPWVYSLSLAVYCTSWTFYGSVGRASVSGLSFLTIYLGPTIGAALWWIVLGKMITIAREHRITTIADFIGSRYGNSLLLAGIVTIVAAIGITPYLGLQIKAILRTFSILAGEAKENVAAGLIIILVIALFADIFCVRRQEFSEKHEGIVFAVAIESIVKLGAFLALGVYVTYSLFGGFGDILVRAREAGLGELLLLGGGGRVSYSEWASLTLLSMTAVVFLPRQFQVAVVENYDTAHLSRAVWLFPLYLLLINLFVLPVALGGLLLGGSPAEADTFGLTIPMGQGARGMALLVFLGGLSAASGMIIVESLAVSNMVMNNLVNPAVWRFSRMRGFPFVINNVKRLIIMATVFLGYVFAVTVGEYLTLVDMGLKSFVAVTIFAPSVLLGLYWKRGNRNGAMAGTLGGFAMWLYTLFLPALVTAGVVDESGALGQLMQSKYFHPYALFGVHGLDKWSNALFWGMLVNVGLYIVVSLLTEQSEEEERMALAFVDSYSPELLPARGSVDDIEEILGEFIGGDESTDFVDRFLRHRGVARGGTTGADIALLRSEARKILSGMLGSSIAKLVLEDRFAYTEEERVELLSTIKEMNTTLRYSRRELADTNRQLALLKEFSENIIESLPIGVTTLDPSLRVTYWNRVMEHITGFDKQRALGALAADVLTCLPPESFSPQVREGEVRGRAGSADLQGYVSRLTGASPGYVIVLEDVTEKKKMEEELFQATKHATIGRLAAGVSHEVGNPLASISSLVQELLVEDQTSFQSESLHTIDHHVHRIARIVRSLGDFARINPRKKELSSLKDTLESTLKLVRFDKGFRQIRISTDLAAVPPVMMDPDRMQQVFLNIMLNARDAMPGGGDLNISLRRAGGGVEMVFADSGIGVDPAIRDKIFDPFFTTKGPTRGTGLGLGISYGIIKDHGGSIDFEAVTGGGARFIIRLPLEVGGKEPG